MPDAVHMRVSARLQAVVHVPRLELLRQDEHLLRDELRLLGHHVRVENDAGQGGVCVHFATRIAALRMLLTLWILAMVRALAVE